MYVIPQHNTHQVTARVGKGEQVLVCGDAPFLGGGDPDRALPLYTTPADYPLWFTKVMECDVPFRRHEYVSTGGGLACTAVRRYGN